MIFGHLPEILLLLFLALLVFGPKRMIEMGSSVGRMFRELRDATREMNWSTMFAEHEDRPQRGTFSTTAQPQSFQPGADPSAADGARATTAGGPTIVEGTIEQPKEPLAE